jgi:eukaryotic-like serine/threonine-protein kinase
MALILVGLLFAVVGGAPAPARAATARQPPGPLHGAPVVSSGPLLADAIRSGRVRLHPATPPQVAGPSRAAASAQANLQADEGGGPVNEDPIAVDPRHTRRILTGGNDSNCPSFFPGFDLSVDGGATWRRKCLSPAPGTIEGNGDPIVAFDDAGAAYVGGILVDGSALSWSIGVQRSTDLGRTWSATMVAVPPIYPGGLSDKPWLEVDTSAASPHQGTLYVSTTQCVDEFICDAIAVSRSTDQGATWSTSMVSQDPGRVDQFSDMAIGPDGTVYVTWLRCDACAGSPSSIMFASSTDGGASFGTPVPIQAVTLAPSRSASAHYGDLPNTDQRVSEIPVVAVDDNTGPHGGNLYVADYTWTGSFMQVRVATSVDGGTTWGAPVPLAPADDTRDQFFPWLNVSGDGVIGASWMDRYADPSDLAYEAVASTSSDGGTTFTPEEVISEVASDPTHDGFGGRFIGDYTGNAWTGRTLRVSWMDTRTGESKDEIGGLRVGGTGAADPGAGSSVRLAGMVASAVRQSQAAPATIDLQPVSGPPGTSVIVTGSGFPAPDTVDLLFDDTTVGTASPNALGTFSANFTVPVVPGGDHTVTATGEASEQRAQAPFAVVPAIAGQPDSGFPLESVQVSGTGFGPNETVDLGFDATSVGSASSDDSGSISVPITIPEGAAVGTHSIIATGEISGLSAQADFEVVSATISLGADSGFRRAKVAVSGTGFEPFESIDVTFDGSQVGSASADDTGSFSSSFLVPPDAALGSHDVSARGGTSARSATATFTVISHVDWGQAGFDAAHTSFDPYETRLGPTNIGGLGVRWSVLLGDQIGLSAPIVVGRTALAFRADGALLAFDLDDGAPLWTSSTPPSQFHPRPAAAGGLAFTGSDDGTVTAVDLATGATVWTTHAPAAVQQDLAVDGSTLFVSAADGSLIAFDTASGTLLWSSSLGGAGSAPAIADGVVYVGGGGSDQRLYALEAATGAAVWTTPVLGSDVSTPAVANGLVYVGVNTNLKAFDAATGAPAWSAVLPSGTGACDFVVSQPGVAAGVAYTSSSCSMNAVDGATGHILWTTQSAEGFGAYSPTIAGGVVYHFTNTRLQAFDAATGAMVLDAFGGGVGAPPVVDGLVIGTGTSLAGTSSYLVMYATGRPPPRPPSPGWPQSRFDPEQDGFNPDETVLGPANVGGLSRRWSDNLGVVIRSNPAVRDGVAYMGTNAGTLIALDTASGAPLSQTQVGDAIASTPSVVDGTVYVGSFDGMVSAVPATCRLTCPTLWRKGTTGPVQASPTVSDGVVYVGSWDGLVYAFDARDGTTRWRARVSSLGVFASPAVADGVVFVRANDGAVHALDAESGAELWATGTGAPVMAPIVSSPAVGIGNVYVGGDDGVVRAFDAVTGSTEWTVPTGASIWSSPALADGTVFIGSNDQRVYALDATSGTSLWSVDLGAAVDLSPAVANGVVYAQSDAGQASALDGASGAILWTDLFPGGHLASLTVANGAVLQTTTTGLAAFGIDRTSTQLALKGLPPARIVTAHGRRSHALQSPRKYDRIRDPLGE